MVINSFTNNKINVVVTVTSTMVINTHRIFLGFKFLVRNEEKKEIPCRGTRKIRGISGLTFLSNLSKK